MTEGVGLVFVTLEEAEVLCEARDPQVIGARLTASYREVVLKLGADGAHWFSDLDPVGVEVPAAAPTGPVVDTTGAGDAFAAAFLAARSVGADPARALRSATRAAADVVTGPGARSAAGAGAIASTD
jgi:sugar/nucleoside kinase (ribokinase family)